MSWSWTLYRYLASQFLLGVAVIYGAFLLLAFSMDVVDLINRTAGHGIVSTVIIGMALLQLPDIGQKLLPFAVLLGGVFCFVRLSRSQELVATRAAGVSAWDFLVPPLAVAIVIGLVHVLAVTPISSRMLAQFSALEAKYIKGQASQLSVSVNGLWLRQGDENQQSVIHALTVSDQGVRLDDVIVILYGPNDHVDGRIDIGEKIVRKLRTGMMPPENAPKPSASSSTNATSPPKKPANSWSCWPRRPSPPSRRKKTAASTT